jgi:hypothetical protein
MMVADNKFLIKESDLRIVIPLFSARTGAINNFRIWRQSNPSSQFSSSYQIHLLCKWHDRHVLILYIIEIADPLK